MTAAGHHRKAIWAVALFVALSHCSLLSKQLASSFEQPTLEFDAVEVDDVSLRGLDLTLQFRVTNPNRIDLSLADVDYTLHVEGQKVAAIRPKSGLKLPGQSTVILPFKTRLEYSQLAPVARALWNKGSAQFRADGVIGIQTPIGLLELPFSREGTFNVSSNPSSGETKR